MNDEERQKIALFRYGIIAPAVSGNFNESLSLKGVFRDAANKSYTNPRGEDTRVTASTIVCSYFDLRLFIVFTPKHFFYYIYVYISHYLCILNTKSKKTMIYKFLHSISYCRHKIITIKY